MFWEINCFILPPYFLNYEIVGGYIFKHWVLVIHDLIKKILSNIHDFITYCRVA